MAPTPAAPDLLRLLAADAEDLSVISAALQDAVLKVGDIRWEPKGRRLTLELNRFRWEAGRKERVRSGLQLGDVVEVKARRIRREARSAILSLLAVRFEPGAETPGGKVVFEFAGGADLSVEVECLEAVLADLTEAWPARRTPDHDDQPVGS